MFSANARMERGTHRLGHCINRVSSSAAIFVVNTIALIMAFDESGTDKLGYRATDGGHAGIPDAFVHLRFHELLCLYRIGG